MKAVLLAIAAAGVSAGVLTENQYQYLFTSYVSTHNKQYEMKEYFSRFNTFKNNMDMIIEHNAKPGITHTMGINQFADMSNEEFATLHKFKPKTKRTGFLPPRDDTNVSANVDYIEWVGKKNVNGVPIVGKVEDQGRCGSCWAFSVMGTVEAAYVIGGATEYKKLSEQQLVDCDRYYNAGCDGGEMSDAIDYLQKAGATYLKDYPYTARDGKCAIEGKEIAIPGSAFSYVRLKPDTTGEALKVAVQTAPLSIALAASSADFQFYKSGVITSSSCGKNVNHALVLTGYGNLNGIDYFNIRNSWGATWGDNGYVKVAAAGDVCGLTNHGDNVLAFVKA